MLGNKSAYEEWSKNHKKGENWYPVKAGFTNKNHPVVMLASIEEGFKYSVQRNGNGKYFDSVLKAFDYFDHMLTE